MGMHLRGVSDKDRILVEYAFDPMVPETSETMFAWDSYVVNRKIFFSLAPGQELNSMVVDVYIALLMCPSYHEGERNSTLRYYFDCSFMHYAFRDGSIPMGMFKDDGLAARLCDATMVFIPVCHSSHWVLLAIDMVRRVIYILDSLGASATRWDHSIGVRLVSALDRVFDQLGLQRHVKQFERQMVEDLPQQQNGTDCGVFMISNMTHFQSGKPLPYSTDDIELIRQQIAVDILVNPYNNALPLLTPKAQYWWRRNLGKEVVARYTNSCRIM